MAHGITNDPARMTDEQLLRVIRSHAQPGYYKRLRAESRAQILLWGTMLRREARRRGLKF